MLKKIPAFTLMLFPALALGIAVPAADPPPPISIQIEPAIGTARDSFTITLRNIGTDDYRYSDCCSAPQITATGDGSEAFCPKCPKKPCLADGALLGAGESLTYAWVPADQGCGKVIPRPGIYEVRWTGFPPSVLTRVEILPDPDLTFDLTVDPVKVHPGDSVHLTLTNTLSDTFTYESCCTLPSIIDPAGQQSYCPICPACVLPKDLLPGDVLEVDVTAIEANVCGGAPVGLPGEYRIVWSGFRRADGAGASGEASFTILPAVDHLLELDLSATSVHPGDVLKITATNPLDIDVDHEPVEGCPDVTLLDPLGRNALCVECGPRIGGGDVEVIPSGGTTSIEITIPDPTCGQIFGRWTLIWGKTFHREDDLQGQPVLGLAFIDVSPSPAKGFIRGDCDGNGAIDITDAVFLLGHLFLGGSTPPCLEACDADDSGAIDITDAVDLLGYLFLGAGAPPAPFPAAGADPTPDGLGCGA